MKTVLLVDDSRSARMFVRACLPEGDYRIREAENGEEAVARFREDRPDLVFMDLTMPVMDGFEAVARIREYDPTAVIVVLSADVQPRTVERIESSGCRFLRKPPQRETVRAAIAELFPEGL